MTLAEGVERRSLRAVVRSSTPVVQGTVFPGPLVRDDRQRLVRVQAEEQLDDLAAEREGRTDSYRHACGLLDQLRRSPQLRIRLVHLIMIVLSARGVVGSTGASPPDRGDDRGASTSQVG